jgi:hypothetical protein
MKKVAFLIICNLVTFLTNGQSNEYTSFIMTADSLYKIKEYKKSAFTYSEAFKSNEWKGKVEDRYNAACSWALSNYPDSAFFHLNRIASKGKFVEYDHITADADLNSLHNDLRWNPLLETISENKEKIEVNLNKALVSQLDSIYTEHQKCIEQHNEISKQYGWDSKEIVAYGKITEEKDSINLIKVKAILDKYGWLEVDTIGEKGLLTLILVLHHSDPKTQEKYYPMIIKEGRRRFKRWTEEV